MVEFSARYIGSDLSVPLYRESAEGGSKRGYFYRDPSDCQFTHIGGQ